MTRIIEFRSLAQKDGFFVPVYLAVEKIVSIKENYLNSLTIFDMVNGDEISINLPIDDVIDRLESVMDISLGRKYCRACQKNVYLEGENHKCEDNSNDPAPEIEKCPKCLGLPENQPCYICSD